MYLSSRITCRNFLFSLQRSCNQNMVEANPTLYIEVFLSTKQSFSQVALYRKVNWIHPNPSINVKHHKRTLFLWGVASKNPGVCNFCTSSQEATTLVDSLVNVEMSSEQNKELRKIMNFLISRGCSVHEIKKNYLQHLTTKTVSLLKMIQIAELHPNITLLLPLISLSLSSLRNAAKQSRNDKDEISGFSNRIEYISHCLELSIDDIIPALTKHPSLLTMSFNKLESKMKLLKSAKISSEYIVKDLWIFNYNEKFLDTRISAARQANVDLKPWMLRSSENIFQSMLKKYSETQRILNGEDELAYLAKKLECSEEYVKHMMDRTKQLKAVNIPKLEQVLNFLYEKGYSPQEVRLFPRVFCSSVHTLSKRFEQFRALRNTLPTISQLCIPSRHQTVANSK